MRESFVVYTSYKEQLDMLTIEQKGYLFDAMISYASSGEILDMDGVVQMAFSFIKNQMDRDFRKYDETIEQRRIAGAKGGRPRKHTEPDEAEGIPEKAKKANGFSEKQKKQTVFEKSKGKQKKANESKQKQTKAKKPVYVYDDVYVDVYDDVDVYVDDNKYSCAFEQTWKVYPRKKEKAAAYKAYKARLKDFSEAQLHEAAVKYAEECRILGTEERYIKHGATFFGPSMPFADYLAAEYKLPEKTPSRENGFHNFDQREGVDYDSMERALKEKIWRGE